jgi:hypothetical protein
MRSIARHLMTSVAGSIWAHGRSTWKRRRSMRRHPSAPSARSGLDTSATRSRSRRRRGTPGTGPPK